MKNRSLSGAASGIALLAAVAGLGGLTTVMAGDRDAVRGDPRHFSGLINDYTPSADVTSGGPYEMRGKWSLDVDEARGTARFSAEMTMETSDYGILETTTAIPPAPLVNKDDPRTRNPHTHHFSLADVTSVSSDISLCPAIKPVATQGIMITGHVNVTLNGGDTPFTNPSPVTLCVVGGDRVQFANLILLIGVPAQNHFGSQPIHGVVVRCAGPWGLESRDCTVQE
jgi:hypothetical protein